MGKVPIIGHIGGIRYIGNGVRHYHRAYWWDRVRCYHAVYQVRQVLAEKKVRDINKVDSNQVAGW